MRGHYYPVALDLDGKRCLVAGGGTIATDKVEGLRAAGARVVVIGPQVTAQLESLAASGGIELHRRPYAIGDLDGVFLAYGATDDLAVNARVVADARARGILANAVDDIPNCDFFAMAITRRGDLQVAISTNGRSPAFARWLREYLDDALPEELGDLLDVLGEVREHLKAAGPLPPYEDWRVAITDEVRAKLREGDREGAYQELLAAIGAASRRVAAERSGKPARWKKAS